jgi:hypothetical protein
MSETPERPFECQLSSALLQCDGDKKKATTLFMAWLMNNRPRLHTLVRKSLAQGMELKFPSYGEISLREGPGLADHVIHIARRGGRLYLLQNEPIPAERPIEPVGKNPLSDVEMAVKFRPDLKINHIPKRNET